MKGPTKLQSWLEKRKMTQGDLAKLLGVDTSSVCQWLKGNWRPRLEVLVRIEDMTDIKPREWIEPL